MKTAWIKRQRRGFTTGCSSEQHVSVFRGCWWGEGGGTFTKDFSIMNSLDSSEILHTGLLLLLLFVVLKFESRWSWKRAPLCDFYSPFVWLELPYLSFADETWTHHRGRGRPRAEKVQQADTSRWLWGLPGQERQCKQLPPLLLPTLHPQQALHGHLSVFSVRE